MDLLSEPTTGGGGGGDVSSLHRRLDTSAAANVASDRRRLWLLEDFGLIADAWWEIAPVLPPLPSALQNFRGENRPKSGFWNASIPFTCSAGFGGRLPGNRPVSRC